MFCDRLRYCVVFQHCHLCPGCAVGRTRSQQSLGVLSDPRYSPWHRKAGSPSSSVSITKLLCWECQHRDGRGNANLCGKLPETPLFWDKPPAQLGRWGGCKTRGLRVSISFPSAPSQALAACPGLVLPVLPQALPCFLPLCSSAGVAGPRGVQTIQATKTFLESSEIFLLTPDSLFWEAGACGRDGGRRRRMRKALQ